MARTLSSNPPLPSEVEAVIFPTAENPVFRGAFRGLTWDRPFVRTVALGKLG